MWIDRRQPEAELDNMPDNESDLTEQVLPLINTNKIILSEYGL